MHESCKPSQHIMSCTFVRRPRPPAASITGTWRHTLPYRYLFSSGRGGFSSVLGLPRLPVGCLSSLELLDLGLESLNLGCERLLLLLGFGSGLGLRLELGNLRLKVLVILNTICQYISLMRVIVQCLTLRAFLALPSASSTFLDASAALL